ncbi:hypothetical protein NBCG_02549 [Nocardioidaceae bacterium Broad-1]|nr:hypothetical protein NBCG_02549 [Nocardioidaceae bacterium Broad-1]
MRFETFRRLRGRRGTSRRRSALGLAGRRPRHVVVAGRVVVRDGVLVTADEQGIVAELARLSARAAP